MAFVNIDATAIRVILTDPLEGVVYDEEADLNSVEGIYDAYTYFFEPITRKTDVVFIDIPPYSTASVEILVTGPLSGTAKVGGCIMGLGLDIGTTEVGARVGTQDYSIKKTDAFGNYTILERAFAKKANFTIHIDSRLVDKLQTILATYRATPIVYVGTDSYSSTLIYGFYKSFEIEIGYADGISVCTLEVEGLT